MTIMRITERKSPYEDENFDPEWPIEIQKMGGWKELARAQCREDAEIAGRALAEHYGCELVIEA